MSQHHAFLRNAGLMMTRPTDNTFLRNACPFDNLWLTFISRIAHPIDGNNGQCLLSSYWPPVVKLRPERRRWLTQYRMPPHQHTMPLRSYHYNHRHRLPRYPRPASNRLAALPGMHLSRLLVYFCPLPQYTRDSCLFPGRAESRLLAGRGYRGSLCRWL